MVTFLMAGFVLLAITAPLVPHVHIIHLVKMEHTMLILEAKVLQTVHHVMVVVSVMEKVLVLLMMNAVLVGTVKRVLNHQRQTMVLQGIYVL
jgi:hypothetical protein